MPTGLLQLTKSPECRDWWVGLWTDSQPRHDFFNHNQYALYPSRGQAHRFPLGNIERQNGEGVVTEDLRKRLEKEFGEPVEFTITERSIN